ncbi:transposase domain-containing protein [Pseudonocardia ailaonensis]|uniref:transposase domain-containing protein n=1 Tax=Pseudonocardia ailaonensis TaxID=367279 RepID=UPI003CD07E74
MFAPGHLGELTRYLPVELVDDVLARTHTLQKRLRLLPSRCGVYFVLALACSPTWATRVWAKLCGRLPDIGRDGSPRPRVAAVSEKALRDLRRAGSGRHPWRCCSTSSPARWPNPAHPG